MIIIIVYLPPFLLILWEKVSAFCLLVPFSLDKKCEQWYKYIFLITKINVKLLLWYFYDCSRFMSAKIIRPDDVNTFICILQISSDNDCINLVLVLWSQNMAYSLLLLQANGMIMSVLLHSVIDIDRCMVSHAVVDSFLSSGPFLITVRNENLTGLHFPGKCGREICLLTHRKPWS